MGNHIVSSKFWNFKENAAYQEAVQEMASTEDPEKDIKGNLMHLFKIAVSVLGCRLKLDDTLMTQKAEFPALFALGARHATLPRLTQLQPKYHGGLLV